MINRASTPNQLAQQRVVELIRADYHARAIAKLIAAGATPKQAEWLAKWSGIPWAV